MSTCGALTAKSGEWLAIPSTAQIAEMSRRSNLRLVENAVEAAPRFSIPETESDIHDAAKKWIIYQKLDGKTDDFIVDREDFAELARWSVVEWRRGKPFLCDTPELGRHRIRIPGTRFA